MICGCLYVVNWLILRTSAKRYKQINTVTTVADITNNNYVSLTKNMIEVCIFCLFYNYIDGDIDHCWDWSVMSMFWIRKTTSQIMNVRIYS